MIYVSMLLMPAFGVFLIRYFSGEQEDSTQKRTKPDLNKNNQKHNIRMVWITARPITTFVAGLSTFVILIKKDLSPIFMDIMQTLPMILITMVGFILNDIYDYDKDAISNVKQADSERPIK